jgi:CRAL/TRIO domain
MLILNAPSFFGMAWGLIKKFIDPQTAARIKLYSNKEQGLQALRELIDNDQIPKDYGGTNISMSEAFLEEANDQHLLRQEIELIYVRRKGNAISKKVWDVQEGEYMEVKCYTRTCSGAMIKVMVDGNVYNEVDGVRCDLKDGQPKAACHILAPKIKGPCTVSLDVQDLDNADKAHSGQSRGYFLCVGDLRSMSDGSFRM